MQPKLNFCSRCFKAFESDGFRRDYGKYFQYIPQEWISLGEIDENICDVCIDRIIVEKIKGEKI